jgi:hypothetical protein
MAGFIGLDFFGFLAVSSGRPCMLYPDAQKTRPKAVVMPDRGLP